MIGRGALLIALAVLVLFPSCRAPLQKQARASPIPSPDWAPQGELVELPGGQVELSFVVNELYPSARVRDFYAQWAADHGWEKVTRDEDKWAVDQWGAVVAPDGGSVDMWTAHWRDPQRTQSLFLVLRYRGDRARQEVFVKMSPYFIVDPGAGKTLGDYIDEWERTHPEPP